MYIKVAVWSSKKLIFLCRLSEISHANMGTHHFAQPYRWRAFITQRIRKKTFSFVATSQKFKKNREFLYSYIISLIDYRRTLNNWSTHIQDDLYILNRKKQWYNVLVYSNFFPVTSLHAPNVIMILKVLYVWTWIIIYIFGIIDNKL